MGLSTELLASAKNEIQKSIITDLQRRITRAEGDAASNRTKIETNRRYAKQYAKAAEDAELGQPDLDQKVTQAKETLAVLLSAFGSAPAEGPFKKYAGRTFHMDSKTGGKGHFMEVNTNGALKCTCTAAAFDNECWAIKEVTRNLHRDDTSYTYPLSRSNFDARVRPTDPYFRVPGYTGRVFSRYSTLR